MWYRVWTKFSSYRNCQFNHGEINLFDVPFMSVDIEGHIRYLFMLFLFINSSILPFFFGCFLPTFFLWGFSFSLTGLLTHTTWCFCRQFALDSLLLPLFIHMHMCLWLLWNLPILNVEPCIRLLFILHR